MSWNFKPSDWLATVSRKPSFLGKQIQAFQRHIGFTEPASLATHAEVVWWVAADGAEVTTFSQTFPKAIPIHYRRSDGTLDKLEAELSADKPEKYLFRIREYERYVRPDHSPSAYSPFIYAMDLKFRELLNRKPKGIWGKLGFNYDWLQLAGYWLNNLLGRKKHINWLEIPGGVGVCSDKAAEGLDAGFHAVLGYSPLFPIDPNAEVTPAHIWTEPLFRQVTQAG